MQFARIIVPLSACLFVGIVQAADWPGFRGPNGSAASDDKDLPAQWTKENIHWKLKLPGPGTSSPITTGDKIFVTAYSGYCTSVNKGKGGMGFPGKGFPGKGPGGKGFPGKGPPGKGGFSKGGFGKGDDADAQEQMKLRFVLLCLDRHKGQILWQKEIQPKLPETPASGMILEHGYSSSTPVTDGESVFAFFGKTGVVAFDLAGNKLWQADVGSGKHMWGTASSPVLYKNLVIVNAAMESGALVGLDKKTGKEIWRKKGISPCWTSPLIAETPTKGRTSGKSHELILSLPGKIVGYDPETGNELWHCQGIGKGGGAGGGFGGGGFGGFGAGYTCSTPVAKDGVVYVIGGGGPNGAPTAIAVRAGGNGDVTKSHVVWRQKAGASFASPVVSGDRLHFVAGNAYCLKLDTGEVVYNERLYSGGNEYVSAVAADGKIFALTRTDGVHVLAAGDKFESLAHNEFAGDKSIFNASPAVSSGRLYIRSNEYLYCIGKK
ncbi:MAG: PQQ-binding-like beta-propeller repeat protein [Gemmataceae bacterium]|nr:PQQ-binding-like beta-propeller repeat protein [Gemmataceae bacterium]